MVITQKHLSRRTVLRGLGVTLALPMLEAMTPAGKAFAQARPKVRFSAIEMVHGSAGATKFGLEKNMWSPAQVGRAFDLSPHTVKRHVANILDKLGVESRGQAAAWYRRHH